MMSPQTTTETGARSREGRDGELTVAVTGASGTVGPALLHRLVDCRHIDRVRVLGRHRTSDMPSGIDFREVDVRDETAVEQAVAGADVVVHLAFALYGVIPGAEDQLFAANVLGTQHIARAAAAQGCRRFVYTSSAAVYGLRPDNPQPLSEKAEIRASARHFYSRHKAQAELVISETLAGSNTEAYILRPCGIVGPHASGAIVSGLPPWLPAAAGALLRSLARVGLRPYLPPPPVALQFVHEDDVAQALELAVLGAAEPGFYNIAGDGAVLGPEAVSLLGFRSLPVPRAVVDGALRLVSEAPAWTPATVWPALVTEPLIIDTTKARRELGWNPRFDSRGALQSTRQALGW